MNVKVKVYNFTKVAQKVLENRIFVASNLLYKSFNLVVGYIDECVTHLILLHNLNQRSTALHHRATRASVPFLYCTSINFVLAATSAPLQ